MVLACGGSTSTGTGSAALDAAAPSFAALALDQAAADTSPPASALLEAPDASLLGGLAGPGGGCHPHLFMREREVVERVNRHVYKVLRHDGEGDRHRTGQLHGDLEDVDQDRGWASTSPSPSGSSPPACTAGSSRPGPPGPPPPRDHVRRDRSKRIHRRPRGQGHHGGGFRAPPRRLPGGEGSLGHARGPVRRVGGRPEDRGAGHRRHLGPRRRQVRRRHDPDRPLAAPQRRVRLLPRGRQGRQPEDPGRDGLPLRHGSPDREPGPDPRERPDGLPLVPGRRRQGPRPERRAHHREATWSPRSTASSA